MPDERLRTIPDVDEIGKPVVAQFDLDTGKILRSVEVPWGVGQLLSVEGGRSLYAFGQDLYRIDTTGSELRIAATTPMFDKGMNILPLWMYDTGGVTSLNYYTEKYMGILLIDRVVRADPGQGDRRPAAILGCRRDQRSFACSYRHI